MNAKKVLRFKNSELPRQSGEVARIRVLKGADVGAIFVITQSTITLGRGAEVDLIISDVKASRSHARLDFTKDGWIVSDLGSANGIFFQGEYIRKFALRSGDHFTLGETILEFLVSHETTQVLVAPLRDGQEVQRMDQALSKQKIRVQNLGKGVQATASKAKAKSNPLPLLVIVAALGFYLFTEQGTQTPTNSAKKKVEAKTEEDRTLASYLPTAVSKEIEKTADQYYWAGFREYMKGNYLRAKDSFELALQVNPGHEKARHYLASAEKENNDEIKKLIAMGNKAKDIGRMSAARGYYETAMRHMYNDRANPDYIECEEALKALKAGGE